MGEDPRDVEQRIENTRERMGDTVEALSAKADVPGRVKGYMEDKKDAVTSKVSDAKEKVTGAAGSVARQRKPRCRPSRAGGTQERRHREGEPARSRDRIGGRRIPARHGPSHKPDRGRAPRAAV